MKEKKYAQHSTMSDVEMEQKSRRENQERKGNTAFCLKGRGPPTVLGCKGQFPQTKTKKKDKKNYAVRFACRGEITWG